MTQSDATRLGPITTLAQWVFSIAKWLAPMHWLRKSCPLLRYRSELSQKEVRSLDFTRRRVKAVDIYVLSYVAVEVVLVTCACLVHLPLVVAWLAILIVGLRIIEIMQVTVNATVFDQLAGRPDNRVASKPRMVVLAILNFAELCLCFGVVYALNISLLHGTGRAATGFYFSVITQLTIGYGDVHPISVLRVVAALQGLIGVVFVVLVLARLIATLPRIDSVLDRGRR